MDDKEGKEGRYEVEQHGCDGYTFHSGMVNTVISRTSSPLKAGTCESKHTVRTESAQCYTPGKMHGVDTVWIYCSIL